MERKIVVTGVGEISKAPDAIEISISLGSVSMNYSESLHNSAVKIDGITSAIIELGIDEKKLKTTHYAVRTVYKSERDSAGNYRQVFSGYSTDHNLSLEIDMDIELLGNILTSITSITGEDNSADSKDRANIKVDFTLKDKESIGNEAVEKAVKVAKEKAKMLALASDVELGEIIDINYSFSTVNIYSRTEFTAPRMMKEAVGAGTLGDLTPADVKVSDNVTVTWLIK